MTHLTVCFFRARGVGLVFFISLGTSRAEWGTLLFFFFYDLQIGAKLKGAILISHDIKRGMIRGSSATELSTWPTTEK